MDGRIFEPVAEDLDVAASFPLRFVEGALADVNAHEKTTPAPMATAPKKKYSP